MTKFEWEARKKTQFPKSTSKRLFLACFLKKFQKYGPYTILGELGKSNWSTLKKGDKIFKVFQKNDPLEKILRTPLSLVFFALV